MALLTKTDLLTLDYSSNGQPFAYVSGNGTTDTTLNYSSNGEPFVFSAGTTSSGTVKDAEATLTSVSSISAAYSLTKSSSATLTSASSLSSTISHIEGADLTAFSNSSLTSNISRIRSSSISINSNFNQSANGLIIKSGICSISSASTVSCSADVISGVIVEASGGWTSSTSVSTAAYRIRSLSSNLNTEFTQSSTENLILNASGEWTSTSNVDALAYRTQSLSSNLNTEFTQTTQALNVKGFNSSLISTFTEEALIGKIQQAEALFTGAFTPTLTAIGFKNYTAVIDSTSSMTADAMVNRSANVLLEHIADLNAMADKTAAFDSALSITSTQTATALRTAPTTAALTTSATLYITAGKFKIGSSSLTSTSSLFLSRNVNGRPRAYTTVGSAGFDTNIKKFGSASYTYNGAGYQDQNYVRYAATVDWTKTKTIDFWWYHTTGSGGYLDTHDLINWYQNNNNYKAVQITPVDAGLRRVEIVQTINGTQTIKWTKLLTASSYPNNTWYHFRILDDGSSLTVWLNGVRLTKDSGTYVSGLALNVEPRLGRFSAFTGKLDELLITKDIITPSSTSSFTPPTTPWTFSDQSNVLLLAHFDQSFVDDVSTVSQYSSQLTASASLTAQADANTKSVTANIAANSAVNVSGFFVLEGASALTSVTTLSAIIGTLENAISLEAGEFTLVADNVRTREVEIAVMSAFTPSVSVNANKVGEISLSSEFTSLITVQRSADLASTISSSSTLTAWADGNIKSVTADLLTSASLTVVCGKIQYAESAISSAFSATMSIKYYAGIALLVSNTASLSTTPTRIARVTKTLQVTATEVTVARKTAAASSAIASNGFLITAIGRVLGNASDISITSTLIADVLKLKKATADLNSFFTVIASGPRYIGRPLNITTLGTGSYVTGKYGQAYAVGNGQTGWTLPTSNKYAQAGVVDFWLGIEPASGQNNVSSTVFQYGNKWTISVLYTAAPNYHYIYFNGVQIGGAIGVYGGSFNWQQIRVVRSGDDYTIYANGSEYTITNSSAFSGSIRFKPIASVNSHAIDELLITDATGITNTITTAPYLFSDQTNVIGLWHFNGVATDDTSIRGSLSAGIVSETNLSVSATKVVSARSTSTASASMTVNAVKTASSITLITSVSSQTLNYTRIRYNASFQQQVASLSSAPVKLTSAISSISSNFALSNQGSRIRFGYPELSAIAIELTAAFRNASGTVSLETSFAVIASVNVTADTPINTTAFASLASTPTKAVFCESLMSSTAELSANIDRIQPVGAYVTAVATVTSTTTDSKITRITATPTVNASLVVTANRFRETITLEVSAATVTCQNDVLRLAQANLTDSFDILASPTFIVRVTAEFTAFNAVLTVGDVINIDPYRQLLIEPETRTLFILPENRIITIEQETRVNII